MLKGEIEQGHHLAMRKEHIQVKCVSFAQHYYVGYTHSHQEYDRSGALVARLNYKDMLELMTFRSELRRRNEQERFVLSNIH